MVIMIEGRALENAVTGAYRSRSGPSPSISHPWGDGVVAYKAQAY